MSRDPNTGNALPVSNPAKRPLPLWAALASALVLILLPGFIVGPLHVPLVVLWALGALLLSFKSGFAQVRNQRVRNLVIYLFAAALAVAVHVHRLDAAQARGETLVSAIKAYRAENKTYPPSLEALAPKYIDTIPTGAFGRFYYLMNKDKAEPFFFYVTLPPFGRKGYCFDEAGKCAENLGGIAGKDGWYDFD